MTPATSITIALRDGRLAVTTAPAGGPVSAELFPSERQLRVALRGDGDVEVRFEMPIRDVDVRGGYLLAVPGTPYIVRAPVKGWLSITAKFAR